MVWPKREAPRGILRPQAPVPGYRRFWPEPDLAPFVEHFWTVEWDLAEPTVHEVLPHPSFHLVIEKGRSAIVGVPTGRFTRRLEGQGRVLAAKFLPGAFRSFLPGAAAEFTGRSVALDEILDGDAATLEKRVLADSNPVEAFNVIQKFLRSRQPLADEKAEFAAKIVLCVAAEREVTRVEDLVRKFAINTRSLQRLFSEYVGVTPKWVIQRYRLHEAAEKIAAAEVDDWTALALELGYADQAHFIRDFRRWVGRSPASYARVCSRRSIDVSDRQ